MLQARAHHVTSLYFRVQVCCLLVLSMLNLGLDYDLVPRTRSGSQQEAVVVQLDVAAKLGVLAAFAHSGAQVDGGLLRQESLPREPRQGEQELA